MNRLLAAIIIFIISLGFWGCGAQEKPQFVEATNQYETIQHVSFQVPKEWVKYGDGISEAYYFETEDSKYKNGCAAYFLQGKGFQELISDAIERYQEVNGDIEVDISEIEVSNTPATVITLRQEVDGEAYTNSTILFEVENGIMMFASNSHTKVAYDDFWKVINSIEYN